MRNSALFCLLFITTMGHFAHASEICQKPLQVVCKETENLRSEREKHIQQLKKRINQEADVRAKKRVASLGRRTNFLTKLYKSMLFKNQEIIEVSKEVMTGFDQNIISTEVVENLKKYLEEAINNSKFDFATKRKLIAKMQKVVVGDFADYMDKSGASTSIIMQFFGAHCGLDGLVDNAFATKLGNKDYVLICPGWPISLNQSKDNKDVYKSVLWVLTHEIAHHIDSRDFESDYVPMISCVEKNYTSSFNPTSGDLSMCELSLKECLNSQKSENFLSCIQKSQAECRKQVTISHMGEISADTWAAEVMALYIKGEGLNAEESKELVTQNLMKLCGSGDEGIHTSGDFRITETAVGHEGIREGLGCMPRTVPYCQI